MSKKKKALEKAVSAEARVKELIKKVRLNTQKLKEKTNKEKGDKKEEGK